MKAKTGACKVFFFESLSDAGIERVCLLRSDAKTRRGYGFRRFGSGTPKRGAAFVAESCSWLIERRMAAHLDENGDAHFLQNFAPSRLLLPHLAHRVFPFGAQLSAQLIEQSLRLCQVGSVKALGEPAVGFGEHGAAFVAPALPSQEPREARGCP